MKITEYVNNVQTFKKSELIRLITVLSVGSTDMAGNLERILANKVNLDTQAAQWAVTKSVIRDLDNNGYRGIGFTKAILSALQTVSTLTSFLETAVQKDKDQTWDGKLINLRQANILMSIEQLDHWMKYTSLMLDVLLSLNNQSTKTGDDSVSKLDLRFLTQTLEYYKGTLLWLLKGSKAIMLDLANIPEVDVTESSIGVMEGSGMTTLLTSQSLGMHSFNPKYWWKLNRMKRHVEEIEDIRLINERFAMKITQAVNLRNGTNDAELEERIEDYQNRILRGHARIAEIDNMYRSAHG